jgi:hypothetical protein
MCFLDRVHRATLVAQGQFFADVVSTDDWLGRIGAAFASHG